MDIALALLDEVVHAVKSAMPADATLARMFKQHHEFGSRDRRHYAHVVFTYFRWRGWITHLAPDELRRQIAWAIALDGNSQEDPLYTRWTELTGLDAATLTNLGEQGLEGKRAIIASAHPSVVLRDRDLVPDWVPSVLPDEKIAAPFIAACQSRPPTWVYIEPSRIRNFSTMLSAQQIRHWAHPVLPGAIALETPFQKQLLERAWGCSIQVQDIGSQTVATICHAQPGESWWDACCGAGGKTLQLARQVGPSGAILATDVRESILNNLQLRASSFRFDTVATSVLDSAIQLPEGRIFDGILVDAPCSGLGTWPRNPDARWRLNRDDITARAELQGRMLHNVASRVKTGGLLIYSVCTVTQPESSSVIDDFLQHHPHFQRDPFSDPLTGDTCKSDRLILPGEGPGDGMFTARLRRVA
jgi:16S rRNA (cytosine967-C5)-methyltransferase